MNIHFSFFFPFSSSIIFTVKNGPFFATKDDIALYRDANPLMIDCSFPKIDTMYNFDSKQFRVDRDVITRPYALIGYNFSDTFSFTVDRQLVRAHLHGGVVRLEYLTSYEKVGTMCFQVSRVKALSDTECAIATHTILPHECRYRSDKYNNSDNNNNNNSNLDDVPIKAIRVDALLDHASTSRRVSVSVTKDLLVDVAQFENSCMRLRITILKSFPRRKHNKIKINGFYIF